MDILGLTNFAQVRGVLTVSEADLPDETLEAYALEDDLGHSLEELDADWESVVTEAVPAKLRLLRLYSKYYCAGIVAGMAEVFVLKKDTDGSNEGQRAGTGLDKLQGKLMARANKFKEEYLLEGTVGPTVSIVSAVSPARDVIVEARDDAP